MPIAPAPRRPRSVLVLLLLSLGLVASACSRREMLTDAAVPDGGTDANDLDVGQDAAVESVTLYPLEREIVIRDGVIPRVPLEVRAHYGEGTEEVVVPATFTVTPGRLAVLDGTDLVPTGVAGGEVHVRLQALGRQGRYVQTETFVVRLETTVFGRDVDPAIVADFESSTEDASVVSPTLGYPLDGARIPMNLASPTFAWTSGRAPLVERVIVSKPHARITYYGLNGFVPTLESWRGVLRTDVDEPVAIELTRLDRESGHRGASTEASLHVARTALSGAVYYWNVAATRIFRIDDGASERTDFMPSPSGCVGCHTVSPSGRHMIASIEDGRGFIGTSFDLETDLSGPRPPIDWDLPSEQWYSAVISPDETTVIGATDRGLVALDLATGAPLVLSRSVPNAASPTFTPDGRNIVYVETAALGPIAQGQLSTVSYRRDDVTIELGDPQLLVPGSDLQYPTFSPDGAVLAYGTIGGILSVARVHRGAADRLTVDSPQRLRTDLVGMATHPVFSPFVGDGFYWLGFHSTRRYTPGGTGPFVWVSAIRTEWTAGTDPSEPPYWLVGQSTGDANLSAYWSRRECRDPTMSCTIDVECCSGYCRIPPGATEGMCSTDLECRIEGESCTTSSDCCAGDLLDCVDGLCTQHVE
ncbi:MAG: hypothetical protein U0353_08395 [Sandaracinus sp.]